MFKKWKDLILGVVMAAFSVFYLINASQIKINTLIMGSHASYANGRIVPYLLGGLLAFLSIVLIIQAVRKLAKEKGQPVEKKGAGGLVTVVLTFAVIMAYILLLPTLGFILGTILYLFCQIVVLAPRETLKKKLWVYAVVAVVFSALVFVAFRLGLNQPLPRGVIENIINI